MARPKKVADERKATGKAAKDGGKVAKAKKPSNGAKRPLNSYMLFSQDVRAKAGDTKVSAQELGQRWKELDPALKASYDAKAKEARNNYVAGKAPSSKPIEKKNPKKKEDPAPSGGEVSDEEEMDEEESDDES